jgi:RNA polymerase sigma-70 factor (ECF subfamily)
LTQGLAAGDEGAFREFHAVYFDRLYQFLLVVARGQEDEAQEALQQTFLRVLRYARVFDSEEIFWSWLKMLARSAARDAGRKRHRYWSLLEKFALFRRTEFQAPQAPHEDSLRAALEESLEELEAADRRLIEGKYLEGATVKELGAQLGLTEKAVESRLARLRQQLRERLLRGKDEG